MQRSMVRRLRIPTKYSKRFHNFVMMMTEGNAKQKCIPPLRKEHKNTRIMDTHFGRASDHVIFTVKGQLSSVGCQELASRAAVRQSKD